MLLAQPQSFLLGLFLAFTLSVPAQKKVDVDGQLRLAAQQYKDMVSANTDLTRFPQSIKPDGGLKTMPSEWWCSGFFGGSLWYLYEYTKDADLKEAAHRWTMAVEKEKFNTGTHDLGFMLFCPFGNGYRLTQNASYREPMLTGARSLATRFDPNIGLIRSWNKFRNFDYPVIIDNMMNLELLLWAADNGGDASLRKVALTHADNTIKHHFRPDGSSYHLVCYAPDGKVVGKVTAQGKGDETAWARGQAWALYGYTSMYRLTRQQRFLDQAEKIAAFVLQHPNMPADKVPYWDFDAPGEERDASAAAIMAAALLELSDYSKKNGTGYFTAAEQMLQSLSAAPYRTQRGEAHNFLLKHAVGHKPAGSEIDTPLIYGDYYFLEALLRYNRMVQKKG